jgi:hypothetical protein
VRTLNFRKQSSSIKFVTPKEITINGVYLYGSVYSTEGREAGSNDLLSVTSLTPMICSVNDIYNTYGAGTRSTIRARTNGICTIRYVYNGDANLLPSTIDWSQTISGINTPAPGSSTPQVISFPLIADREYGPGYILNATASSGLPISYKSLTPNVCYVLYPTAGAAVQSVNPTPPGDYSVCTIEASQPGDDRYVAATPISRTFKWTKAQMKITPYISSSPSDRNSILTPVSTSTNLKAGFSYTFVASTLFASGNNSGLLSIGHLLEVTSSSPAVCSVSAVTTWDRPGGIYTRATITTVSKGTCSVNWKFNGTESRASASYLMNVLIN